MMRMSETTEINRGSFAALSKSSLSDRNPSGEVLGLDWGRLEAGAAPANQHRPSRRLANRSRALLQPAPDRRPASLERAAPASVRRSAEERGRLSPALSLSARAER